MTQTAAVLRRCVATAATLWALTAVIAAQTPTAAQLYQKAAKQGLADAQFALSICYECGEGVERDPVGVQEAELEIAVAERVEEGDRHGVEQVEDEVAHVARDAGHHDRRPTRGRR